MQHFSSSVGLPVPLSVSRRGCTFPHLLRCLQGSGVTLYLQGLHPLAHTVSCSLLCGLRRGQTGRNSLSSCSQPLGLPKPASALLGLKRCLEKVEFLCLFPDGEFFSRGSSAPDTRAPPALLHSTLSSGQNQVLRQLHRPIPSYKLLYLLLFSFKDAETREEYPNLERVGRCCNGKWRKCSQGTAKPSAVR